MCGYTRTPVSIAIMKRELMGKPVLQKGINAIFYAEYSQIRSFEMLHSPKLHPLFELLDQKQVEIFKKRILHAIIYD